MDITQFENITSPQNEHKHAQDSHRQFQGSDLQKLLGGDIYLKDHDDGDGDVFEDGDEDTSYA
jgi:hypothetical protein